MKTGCRHPWLDMTAAALFDLGTAGFFALGLCREQITGMQLLPLAAALLGIGAFDLLLLRTPKSLGKYLLLNLIPVILWTVLLFRCTEFAVPFGELSGETAGRISGTAAGSVFGRRSFLPAFPPGLLPRILLPVFGLILPARRMYIAVTGTEPKAQILYVDGAAGLLILVRWVQHYLKRPDLDTGDVKLRPNPIPENFIVMKDNGMSNRRLAQVFGVSPKTILNWKRRLARQKERRP